MKILPIHLSGDPDALETASDALTAPLDSAWLSALAFPGDPAWAPASGLGAERLSGEGALGDYGGDLSLGEAAPADNGGVVALADSFVFDDAPVLPADSADVAATMASLVFAASATASAERGGFGAGVDAAVCDTDPPSSLGSGGIVVPSPHLETSATPSSVGNGVAALTASVDPGSSAVAPGHDDAGVITMPTVFAPVTPFVAPVHEGSVLTMPEAPGPAISGRASVDLANLANPPAEDPHVTITNAAITNAGVGSGGATAAQVQQAIGESGLTNTGAGITVGVLSDSFNDLGGAAADEASGALPPAADIDVIKDLTSGGSDEGRAMMQIIHDIAPGADLAFYTAFDSEQDFANGILALAAAGCKAIVDDVSYFDEPFFQNGVVAQAIQTVESEGVTYVTAAGNEASNGYQASWTPITTSFHGTILTDAESFGGSPVQTVTINTEATGDDIPLVLEWNQAYGSVSASTADLELLVFNRNGTLIGSATNASDGEPSNPWVEYDFAVSGTYSVAVVNLHTGTNPGLIKEITEGDGLPATISGANTGTVVGHATTPGAVTAGAVNTADTPAFGINPALSESFSSSGAGTELLFANNGTPLSSPDELNPLVVSGVDNINTTVAGGLSDFYGTSAAAASLAGVAALILSADPNLTPALVETVMQESALPMANSAVSGAGLVQVDPAVAAANGNQPDLTAYLSNGSMTAAAGSSINLQTWTDNLGGASTGSSTTAIFLSSTPTITTSDTLLGTISAPALAAYDFVGWFNYQLASMTLPNNLTPGTYYLGGFADYNGQIVETNNNDNVVQLTVTAPPQPDLTAYLSNGSMTAAAGSSINVQTWTDNLSTGSSGPSTTAIFLSSTPTITTSDTLLGTISAPALAAENNTGWYNYQLVSMTLPNNLTPGTYYLGGFADYNGQIVETNNNDNVVQLTVTAPTQPDLTAYLSNGSMIAAAGSSINVQTWTDNLGTGSSGPSTTAIFLSSTPTITTSDTLLGTISAPALAGENNAGWYNYQLVSMTLPRNLTPGTYYLGGFADYNGQIVETNNNDNVVQLTVTATTAQSATSSSIGSPLSEWEQYGGTLNMEPGGAVTDPMVTQALAYSAAAVTPLGSVRLGGPGNDAFIFKSDLGLDAAAAASAHRVELESSSHLLTQLNEFWTAHPFLPAADNGHHTGATNLGIHDGVPYADDVVPNSHAASLVVHAPIVG
jgi:CARDB/Subtilase family